MRRTISVAPAAAAAVSYDEAPPAEPLRAIGDLELDPVSMEARLAGEPLQLTPTEMRLLLEFTAAPGTVLTRDHLLRRVWEYDVDNRVVDVHIQRLRGKLGADRIETVRGFGYKLRKPQ
jgi:DNA-binding response OmpR family regulator